MKKGNTSLVVRVENKEDGQPLDKNVPYENVLNVKNGETKKVRRLTGDINDPTDVLNGEYSNVSAWCSSYHTHKQTNIFEKYDPNDMTINGGNQGDPIDTNNIGLPIVGSNNIISNFDLLSNAYKSLLSFL